MILDDIVKKRKKQLEREEEELPLEELKKRLKVMEAPGKFRLKEAFKNKEFGIIAEVKKASPSLGVIKEEFFPLDLAYEYEKAGAAAISVLTEEEYFMGSNDYLKEIAKEVNLPILRKDFIIDEYQIYHSKYLGASAILLIVAILAEDKLKEYLDLSVNLGLDVLVEVHTKEELQVALKAGSEIIGINNRNLKTFEVDLNTTKTLIKDIPEDRLVISESGIKTLEDIEFIRNLGARGALIGEAFMTSKNIKEKIKELYGEN